MKARGRSITTAVDAVEIARRKFVKETDSRQSCHRNRRDATTGRRKQLKDDFINGDHLKAKLANNNISIVSTA